MVGILGLCFIPTAQCPEGNNYFRNEFLGPHLCLKEVLRWGAVSEGWQCRYGSGLLGSEVREYQGI